MGTITRKGRPAMVLFGFDVVDLATMMPLYTVLDAGAHMKRERIDCKG